MNSEQAKALTLDLMRNIVPFNIVSDFFGDTFVFSGKAMARLLGVEYMHNPVVFWRDRQLVAKTRVVWIHDQNLAHDDTFYVPDLLALIRDWMTLHPITHLHSVRVVVPSPPVTPFMLTMRVVNANR
jgi:acyl-CoA thioesterase